MRADYDPSAETIQIELEPVGRLDRDVVDVDGVVVGLHGGRPLLIDLIGVGPRSRHACGPPQIRHGLDAEAPIAAANAALSAPSRTVTSDVATVPSP
jgi:hypothetical protein